MRRYPGLLRVGFGAVESKVGVSYTGSTLVLGTSRRSSILRTPTLCLTDMSPGEQGIGKDYIPTLTLGKKKTSE